MSLDTIETEGLRALTDLMWSQGGWPMAMNESSWLLEEKTWQEIDESFYKIIGNSPILNIRVQIDLENNTNYALMVILV